MSAGALLEFKLRLPATFGNIVLDIDILVNKVLELQNSELIGMYCAQDPRFQQVALVLKAWNRTLALDKNSRLNSFSIYLLLLAYMLHSGIMVNLQRINS